MKKNMGGIDRVLRLIFGVICAYLGFKLNIAFFVLALFAFYEAFSSWCVLYEVMGISTCDSKITMKGGKNE